MSNFYLKRLACAAALFLSPSGVLGNAPDVGWQLDTSGLRAEAPGRHHQVALASHTTGDYTLAAAEEEADDEEIDVEALAERLDELEEQYGDLKDANADLKKSLKGYAKSGHSGATMKVNGRIHFDMWGFPGDSPGVNDLDSDTPGDTTTSPQDRIGFRRLRFGVKGDLPYNMLYKVEMEFAGGNDSEFRDAYIGWKELPFLQKVLIGNQKRPYGLDHLNSSRYNVFLERPFVIESFNQDARRLGIQSYGVSDDQAWNWRYGVMNQRLVQDEGNYISDHWQSQIAGRLANTIWYDEASDGRGYAHWAVAGTWANTDANGAGTASSEARFRHRPEARSENRWLDTGTIADADDYTLLGLEGVVNVGAVQVVGEYQHVNVNRINGTDDAHLKGAYAYVSYFLTGEHIPWDRPSGTLGRVLPFENFFLVDRCCGGTGYGMGAWQIAARYSYADFVDADILGGEGESITFGLNWHWTPYSRMQFNYIHGDIENADTSATAGPVSGDYDIVGARFMVDF